MTKSAPAPKALEKSPGTVHPPSETTYPPRLCATGAFSKIVLS